MNSYQAFFSGMARVFDIFPQPAPILSIEEQLKEVLEEINKIARM